MWHASISVHGCAGSADYLFALALIALAGVGDPQLGEWRERGNVAVHIRRRMTPAEAARVGPVCDVRGTWEARKRVARMAKYLPPQFQGIEE